MITEADLLGDPEEILKPLHQCKFCPLDLILTDEQKKRKNLYKPVVANHIVRGTMEDICEEERDDTPCLMKYLLMRIPGEDRTAIQIGDILLFAYDLRKNSSEELDYKGAVKLWNKPGDLGRRSSKNQAIIESYAGRFREIWDLGERLIKNEKGLKKKQTLGKIAIYERVVASPELYEKEIINLTEIKKEHVYRDKNGLKTYSQ